MAALVSGPMLSEESVSITVSVPPMKDSCVPRLSTALMSAELRSVVETPSTGAGITNMSGGVGVPVPPPDGGTTGISAPIAKVAVPVLTFLAGSATV